MTARKARQKAAAGVDSPLGFIRSVTMTRPSVRIVLVACLLVSAAWLAGAHFSRAQPEGEPAIKGWKRGVGWGWIWGKDDQVGALNAMTEP
jgi:hypothetical protein